MTEQEWMASSDPDAMLSALVTPDFCDSLPSRLYPLEQRIRLFAAACCRRIWGLLSHPGSRAAVEHAENMAEESPRNHWPDQHWRLAEEVIDACTDLASRRAASAALTAVQVRMIRPREMMFAFHEFSPEANPPIQPEEVFGYAAKTANHCRCAVGLAASPDRGHETLLAEQAVQASLLRCIFGNPFKASPRIDTAWLRWNDGTVARLARSIYDERLFGDMGVLHDALLDAGCDEQGMLNHCKGPVHVRGCWVLDLLLNKE